MMHGDRERIPSLDKVLPVFFCLDTTQCLTEPVYSKWKRKERITGHDKAT